MSIVCHLKTHSPNYCDSGEHMNIYANAQLHVTAFRPISEAAHSWSYDDDI